MARRVSPSTALWLRALALVLLCVECIHANRLVSVPAARPKPIVLTTAKPPTPASKPKTPKPDNSPELPDLPDISGGSSTTTSPSAPNGGGSTTTNANNYVFLPCTTVDVALVMNPGDLDVQQCMAFSTYNFGSGWLPTTLQRSLLCDTGCWNMIDRLQMTPIPYCSVVLGGRAVNYIDALYTVFADCAAGQPVTSPTRAPSMTSSTPTSRVADSSSGVWRAGAVSVAASAVAIAMVL